MYTMDGDFGKVRLFTNVPLKNMEYLFLLYERRLALL